ncbi:MAG: TraM recognition domain-containing protein [Ignavibacteriae bacterium]|nr:TraM recognition domain-containing protein [Ignavibacteriota bacterium]MCB9215722.1 TraM recognition domain-containing protein [Ignavibacteria bacterium]
MTEIDSLATHVSNNGDHHHAVTATTWSLDTPLLEFDQKGRPWTVRNAVEGVQILGGIGSGKTSGSGRTLALNYLAAGFGGLVLTVKPDEKIMWEEYCAMTNRSEDLIIVEPGGKHLFNFLSYEGQGGNTENIVQVLKTVIQASEEKASGAKQDPFWETALDMLIFHVIDLCQLAYGRVTLQNLYDIVQTLPDQGETKATPDSAFQKAYAAALAHVESEVTAWETSLPVDDLSLLESQALYDAAVCRDVDDARLLKYVDQFFHETYGNLSEKTRSIIDFSFSGFLFRLLREPVYSLFCEGDSTFTPEDSLAGKIIVLDLPVKVYHKVGRDCQIMFKYIWQRTMEKRRIGENSRPVFLWADEAQNFLHEYDADYQATARSSRIATVYLSQNLPNYYANMGGAKSEFRVKSFLGTLSTKIFHANADVETNKYASEMIGDHYVKEFSRSLGRSTQSSSESVTESRKLQRVVRPEFFQSMPTGGPLNEYWVCAIVHMQGKVFERENYAIVTFSQNYDTPALPAPRPQAEQNTHPKQRAGNGWNGLTSALKTIGIIIAICFFLMLVALSC